MVNKKGFITTLLATILLLGQALPVHAEEIKRGSCEMTINSSKHTFSSPANASGDCNGLVFGFYNSNQNTFAVTGMVDYDLTQSVQEFVIGTPRGQFPQAVLTVYTVKEAPKPTEPKEEPKEENKPTQPVEQPKEEPKTEKPKTETPKKESKPSVQKPKEESKPNTSSEKPKATQPKTSISQNDSVTSNQSNSKETNIQTEKEENVVGTEVASNTTDEDKAQEGEKEEPESKEENDSADEQPTIRDLLEKEDSEIGRVWHEIGKEQLASYEVKNDSKSSNRFLIYLGIGIGVVLLSGFGWWFYKKKVS